MWLDRIGKWRRRNQPVFCVGGFMRSGTTMMMQALEAGGMRVDRAPKGHELHDVYELTNEDRRDFVFAENVDTGEPIDPRDRFPGRHRGRLFKALTGTVRYMIPQPGGLRCVYMVRDVDEIRASYAGLNPLGAPPARDQLVRALAKDKAYWARPDARVIRINYDDALRDPMGTMEHVRDAGFPINVAKAARIIDPQRQRQFSAEAVHA